MSTVLADDPKRRWLGATASVVLHAVLIALVITQLRTASRGSPAPQLPRSIQITMARSAPPKPRVIQPPAPPVPPKPVEPPKEQKLTTEPTPIPAKPLAAPKKPAPAPTPPAAASATPKPPGTKTTQAPAPVTPPPPVETEEESLIGRIHDNWLEPAHVPRDFRCRVRIDYLPGGRISAVNFVKACVNNDLEESVRRAIWKTQPLPLLHAKTAAGNVEIEFTP
jgi:outer membrane biosynthesis protein TonB